LIEAEMPSLTRVAISKIESGSRGFSIEELFALARFFGLSVDDFVLNICDRCQGSPPKGFACLECGRESKSKQEDRTIAFVGRDTYS
jgi:transcriptional regulator with XRE-family HTH domain